MPSDCVLADQDYAEVGADGEGLGKQRDDLVGRGGGGDVVVLGVDAEQQVADAAAGEVGLMAGLAQGERDAQGGGILWIGSLQFTTVSLLTKKSKSSKQKS